MIDEANIKIGGLYFIDLTRPCRYITSNCIGGLIEQIITVEVTDNEPVVMVHSDLIQAKILTVFVLRYSAFINVWAKNLRESCT